MHAVTVLMRFLVLAVVSLFLVPACEGPFGLGLPSTRALESGAAGGLGPSSFEIAGSYIANGAGWTVDLQLAGHGSNYEHALITQGSLKIEATLIGNVAYYRGQEFLSQHLGTASAARTLVQAAGNAWWKGPATNVPAIGDFTDGARMQATFLGSVVRSRADHLTVDGIDVADLSGPRGDVFISEDPPYRLVRIRTHIGVLIDSIAGADLGYSNYGTDFKIAAPTDVIDFTNLSTLPPLYTVVSVDTSKCKSPCAVSAVVKNLGGKTGAKAPSSVIFTMTDPATNNAVGSCTAQIKPDIGYNATTTVSCSINEPSGHSLDSVIITAKPDNPGHA
jgi:hypothetical protein